jgi:hypothetical protein
LAIQRITPQERVSLQGQVASINAKLSAPNLAAEEWSRLHQERRGIEQKLLEA